MRGRKKIGFRYLWPALAVPENALDWQIDCSTSNHLHWNEKFISFFPHYT